MIQQLKKFKLLMLGALSMCTSVMNATDLIVQETGPVGTYPDILTAVNAAVDGDRIVINNRFGMAPWTGDITITKSLTFMSAAADTFFVVQGNYIISPSAAGKTIKIIGMKNTGNIYTSAAAPTGTRTSVYITASHITGYIDFNQNNFNLTVAGNYISHYIYFRFGKILGNSILGGGSASYCVYMLGESTPTADTNYIVGNKITYTGSLYGVYISSSTQYFYMANNFITASLAVGAAAIRTHALNSFSSTGGNTIVNNSINTTTTNGSYGIYYTGNYTLDPTIKLYIANNLIKSYGTSSPYSIGAIYFSSTANNATIISYNFCSEFYNGYPDNGTNQYNLSMGFTNGQESSSIGVNAGDPNLIYNDLNQTRNDAGAYGGSFTLNNFFYNHASTFGGGKNRVYFVDAPRQVIQGSNMTVKGESYDR